MVRGQNTHLENKKEAFSIKLLVPENKQIRVFLYLPILEMYNV